MESEYHIGKTIHLPGMTTGYCKAALAPKVIVSRHSHFPTFIVSPHTRTAHASHAVVFLQRGLAKGREVGRLLLGESEWQVGKHHPAHEPSRAIENWPTQHRHVPAFLRWHHSKISTGPAAATRASSPTCKQGRIPSKSSTWPGDSTKASPPTCKQVWTPSTSSTRPEDSTRARPPTCKQNGIPSKTSTRPAAATRASPRTCKQDGIRTKSSTWPADSTRASPGTDGIPSKTQGSPSTTCGQAWNGKASFGCPTSEAWSCAGNSNASRHQARVCASKGSPTFLQPQASRTASSCKCADSTSCPTTSTATATTTTTQINTSRTRTSPTQARPTLQSPQSQATTHPICAGASVDIGEVCQPAERGVHMAPVPCTVAGTPRHTTRCEPPAAIRMRHGGLG